MIYLWLFLEFMKMGAFALGGGPATLPFLNELTEKYDWFTKSELANFIAVSESTPGPLGVNMATYAGYNTGGVLGGILATLGLILPSLVVIMFIAKFLNNFNQNPVVKGVFYGIRPAVTAMIAVAVVELWQIGLFTGAAGGFAVQWPLLILCVVVFGLLQIKKLGKLHPIVWILTGAVVGMVFGF